MEMNQLSCKYGNAKEQKSAAWTLEFTHNVVQMFVSNDFRAALQKITEEYLTLWYDSMSNKKLESR